MVTPCGSLHCQNVPHSLSYVLGVQVVAPRQGHHTNLGHLMGTLGTSGIGAMRQRKLGSHTPPCHRRMVITTLFSVLLAALQRRPVLYHTRWLLAVHWHCSSGHRGQVAPTTHPQCRLVSNPCPAGREVVSNSILRGAMAPWLAQRRLRISACAPSVRQLNKSLLLCVWRIPRLLPTLHGHAAHTFMPTCFRLPHMGRTLAAPVVLWLCNT